MPDQPTLTTERLTLRPFALEDAWDVERLAGMREIADTTLNIAHPYPVGAATAWIESHPPAWADGTNATFAIVETKTGELVGAISLMIKREHRRAELGYWIAPDRWNSGYATEASQRLLDFGFELLGLHRIEADHFVRNPASGQVMRKLGMEPEGMKRDWGDQMGSLRDPGGLFDSGAGVESPPIKTSTEDYLPGAGGRSSSVATG